MPIPTPKPDESQDDFGDRCMHAIGGEYEDKKQAYAICMDKYRDYKKKASGNEGVTEKIFLATMHSIRTGDEKNLATFYLMNTSPNRLKWGVTDKALEEALPTLLGQIIGCGPDYATDGHYSNPIPVGKWVSFNKPDGYALATAEITDDIALSKLKRGEWGPISVVIDSYRDRPEKDNQVVESFKFKRVDFVDVPAFPQAGFINFAGLPEEVVFTSLEMCASFYESQSKQGQAAGSLGQDPESRRKKRKMSEELEALKQSFETLKTDYETLKAANESAKTENEGLKGRVKSMEEKRHLEVLTAAIDARKKAGLSADNEAEKLTKYSDEVLILLTGEAERVAEKLEAAKPRGPKMRYDGAEEVTEFDAALKAKRESLGLEGLRKRE